MKRTMQGSGPSHASTNSPCEEISGSSGTAGAKGSRKVFSLSSAPNLKSPS